MVGLTPYYGRTDTTLPSKCFAGLLATAIRIVQQNWDQLRQGLPLGLPQAELAKMTGSTGLPASLQ